MRLPCRLSRTQVISKDTVMSKASTLQSVNQQFLDTMDLKSLKVYLKRIDASEIDEMWSYVAKKKKQRWLWHAIDHASGKTLAYVFGPRKDRAFLKLKLLLKPSGIKKYYTDYWGAYTRHIDPKSHIPGKRNTQKIERKHLNLCARLKRLTRKTICFSKSEEMHDIVIGLFINRYEFGIN